MGIFLNLCLSTFQVLVKLPSKDLDYCCLSTGMVLLLGRDWEQINVETRNCSVVILGWYYCWVEIESKSMWKPETVVL